MIVEVEGNVLLFKAGRAHKFKEQIAEILPFDDCVIVRLHEDSGARNNRNVYSLDYNANLLWQIKEKHRMHDFSPFIGLFRNGHLADLFNYDGSMTTVHPKTGIIHAETMMVMDRGTKRTPTPRRLI